MDVITAALDLVFKSTALYLELNGEKSLNDLHDIFSAIGVCLQKWISDYYVIGGSMFGFQWRRRGFGSYPQLLKRDAEVKVNMKCILQR